MVEKEKSLQLDEDTCFLEWKNIDDAPMRECAAYTVKKTSMEIWHFLLRLV